MNKLNKLKFGDFFLLNEEIEMFTEKNKSSYENINESAIDFISLDNPICQQLEFNRVTIPAKVLKSGEPTPSLNCTMAGDFLNDAIQSSKIYNLHDFIIEHSDLLKKLSINVNYVHELQDFLREKNECFCIALK